MSRTATFIIKNPTQGSAGTGANTWQVVITSANAGTSSVITTSMASGSDSFSMTLNTPSFSTGPINNLRLFVSNNEYISFRTNGQTSQFPTTGYSFDLWAPTIASQIASNLTWGDSVSGLGAILNAASATLTTNKWSVFYEYDTGTALAWSKGGSVGGSVTA